MQHKREVFLHKLAAKFILGESLDVELSGKKAEMDSLFELLKISKELKEQLDLQEDYDKICHLVEEKKIATRRFEDISGITWRL